MTTDGGAGFRGESWRELDVTDRFYVLLNHFQTAQNLADATGLSVKTLRQIFNTLQQGKVSHVLNRSDSLAGLRKARHRMTDHLRRIAQSAQKAEYSAPVFKTKQTMIAPERYSIKYANTGIVVDSYWTSYHVEHLPESQILDIIADMYALFLDTGQFNAFRFEYLVEHQSYFDGQVIYDRTLSKAAEEMDFLKISTRVYPFDEFRGDPRVIRSFIQDDWENLKRRGAIRIQDLLFTSFDDIEKIMPQVRKDYERLKRKVHDGKTRRGKRGRGI